MNANLASAIVVVIIVAISAFHPGMFLSPSPTPQPIWMTNS